MKTLFTKRIQTITSLATSRAGMYAAVAAAVLGVGGSVLAYGPERPTYTIEKPADKITFNAITNNPNYGDERNFMLIKDAANTSAGGWSNAVDVLDGKEYVVRLYVHNNAAANLNLVAENTRVKVNVPTNTATSLKLDGFISANNASPAQVWDDVVMRSDKKFNIAYVQGSTRYHNNVNPAEGFALPDSIVTSAGAQVGHEKMDGRVPGCFKYSGIATFKIKVRGEKTPDFNVKKEVRLQGTEQWSKSVVAKPGQKVDYRIGYDNTGEAQQNNVVVKDALPAGVKYENGTTSVKNAANPNGLKVSDNITTAQGINIGNYGPKANAFTYFSATLPNGDVLQCGENKLVNTATIDTDNGSKSDTAEVVINTECQPNECKPGVPQGDDRCKEVVTPTTLPTTGPTEVILSLIGIAALAAGLAYWYKSRQDLKKVLAGGTVADAAAGDAPKLLKARTDSAPTSETKES